MADALVEKLHRIWEDKSENLRSENLRKGVTCLGVTGTYEGADDTELVSLEEEAKND